jgi:hypothetical protein
MAIAYDTSTDGSSTSGTSLSFTHTTSGSDRILFVGVVGDYTTDGVIGATYNSIAMTLVSKNNGAGNFARWTYLYVLPNPNLGTNSVFVTTSSSQFIAAGAISYTGAKQSGQPDAFTNARDDGSHNQTTSLTTVADNCWLVGMAHDDGTNANAGSPSVLRLQDSGFTGLWAWIDNNGPVTPAGSASLTWTYTNVAVIVMASFAPAPAASVAWLPVTHISQGPVTIFVPGGMVPPE